MRAFKTIIQIIIILIIITFGNCKIAEGPDSSKLNQGFISLFTSYSYNQNFSFVLLTGTLQNPDNTALSDATLYINNILFGSYTRAAMDKVVKTDTSGNFSINANLGNFTIRVVSSKGVELGTFNLSITSSTATPTVSSDSPFFKVTNLVVKPQNPFLSQGCGSICGFFSGATTAFGRFLLYGEDQGFPTVFESIDGVTITQYKIQMGDCTPTSSSFSTTYNGCRIIYAGYDGANYFILGSKFSCSVGSTCTTSATYTGTGPNLGTIVVNQVTPLTTENTTPPTDYISPQSNIYSGGKFHYISNSTGRIYTSANGGSTFTYVTGNCPNLYLVDTIPYCGLTSYYNTGWGNIFSTGSQPTVLQSAGNILERAYYNKTKFQFGLYNSTTKSSSLYLGSGTGANLAFDSTSKLSGTGRFGQFISTNTYTFSYLADITYNSSSPPTFNSISGVRSSDGINYTQVPLSLPTPISDVLSIGAVNDTFFMVAGSYTTNSGKSFLFCSKNGSNWSTVQLSGITNLGGLCGSTTP